jgi:tight adherence protein B
MLSLGFAFLALAVLSWPARTGVRRLRALTPNRGHPRLRLPRFAPGPLVTLLGAGGIGWAALGPATAAASVLAALTVQRQWRSALAARHRIEATTGMAQALRALVDELRAGAHPAAAADGAAQDAERHAAGAMTAIAAAARLGGEIEPALRRTATATPSLAPVLDQLATAWAMVARYGLPLADVLDAVRRDLDHRVRFAKQVHARMAGPRSAAMILAVLPGVGVLLGEMMGAHPLRVLAFTPAGQALLLLGIGLTCAGVAWSGRLTGRTVLR